MQAISCSSAQSSNRMVAGYVIQTFPYPINDWTACAKRATGSEKYHTGRAARIKKIQQHAVRHVYSDEESNGTSMGKTGK